MTELLRGQDPIVAFVGAGASAMPPSRLPTWNGFNDLLLECLCERLAAYSRDRQPTEGMLDLFRARRDQTGFFAPDFQAQLIEEEVGPDYFRVWQSLETDVFGPVHAGLAELASRGRLAAVITTNFDRLVERALEARGVPFRVSHDQAGFAALAPDPAPPDAPLPILKIHGSIEDPDSLVDTLRQRVVGRPADLNEALHALLLRYPWVYLGFSGADFGYDPHYLGILDAAPEARGFVFVAREGAPVHAGVRSLVESFGPEKASIAFGDLTIWMERTFDLPAPTLPTPEAEGAAAGRTATVKARIHDWVEGLGQMAVVNILYAMLKTSGLESQALWLARRTWKSYRAPEDTRGASYARYNYNYGVSLLEVGFITNPVTLTDDMSNLPQWKEHADQNAFEFFARAHRTGSLLPAGARMASLLAYRGELGKAVSLAAEVTQEAMRRDAKLELCDIALASVVIYDLVRLFDPATAQLRQCLELAKDLGDEPRRAMLAAHLGRFMTYGGHFEEADGFLGEAERVAHRLGLEHVSLASRAARGRWLTDSGTSDSRAVEELRSVVDELRARDEVPLFSRQDLAQPDSGPVETRGRNPALCRVLLDLNRAARFAGDGDLMNWTLDELDEVATEHVPGYCPHYYLAFAECLIHHGDAGQQTLAKELIGKAREVGELTGNPWVAQAADRLEAP